MTTTNPIADVAIDAVPSRLEAIANRLNEQLLQAREERLRHRAPKSKYCHGLRRDIRFGKARPFQMLLTVCLADLEDGVPLPVVERVIDELRDSLRELAKPHQEKPLRALLLAEVKAQGAKAAAEMAVSCSPDDPDVLARFQEISATHEAAEHALADEVARRKAAIEHKYPQTAQCSIGARASHRVAAAV